MVSKKMLVSTVLMLTAPVATSCLAADGDLDPDFGTGGRMGAVAISADGKTAAVGGIYFAGAAGAASGAVRLYSLQ